LKRRYRVTLPVEIAGRVRQFGEIVELTLKEALEYSHALIALGDEE
jgi:hypothetical protein